MTLQSEIAEFKAALYGEVGELDAFLEIRNELELRTIWKAILEPEAKAERWVYAYSTQDGVGLTTISPVAYGVGTEFLGRIKLEPME